MNIFGAITIGVFVFVTVLSARLVDKLLPDFQGVSRGGLILFLALLSGCATTKFYLSWLGKKADAHDAPQPTDTQHSDQSSEGVKSVEELSPPTEK